MDMSEAFEKWWQRHCKERGVDHQSIFLDKARMGAWEAWQHLYPEIERAYKDGMKTLASLTGLNLLEETIDQHWQDSTTKARLEGE